VASLLSKKGYLVRPTKWPFAIHIQHHLQVAVRNAESKRIAYDFFAIPESDNVINRSLSRVTRIEEVANVLTISSKPPDSPVKESEAQLLDGI